MTMLCPCPVGLYPDAPYPAHDGAVDWSLQLGTLFRTVGDIDMWEDSLSMEVITWFVHHDTRPSCTRPRPVRLHGHAATWIADLRNVWIDLLDRRIPFSIYVVNPRPPQFHNQRYTCHVLLEQGRT